MKGIYSLVFDCNEKIVVGSIGEKELNGRFCYIGSARGKGGLESRIGRHIDLYKGKKDVRHWHIDYVLPRCDLIGYCYGKTSKDKECELGKKMNYTMVFDGFGSSDCDCKSHLFKVTSWNKEEFKKSFERCDLDPIFKKVNGNEEE